MEATVTVESASISADLKKMAQGEPGLSAYEVAVKEGYTGTEAEWVAYLSTNADQAIAAANAAKASQDAADASATAAASSEDGGIRIRYGSGNVCKCGENLGVECRFIGECRKNIRNQCQGIRDCGGGIGCQCRECRDGA